MNKHPKCILPVTTALVALLASSLALAAPQAHILRIDPRASMSDGSPVLTTVIELVQYKPFSQVTSDCADRPPGDMQQECISEKLLQPAALYTPLKWLNENSYLTVTVDGKDIPASFVSLDKWGDKKNEEGVGTAWLILVDAGFSMGTRFDEGKAVAKQFVASMTPNDIANIMFFNDSMPVKPSGWVGRAQAAAHIDTVTRTYPAQGRTRQLGNIIRTAATDGFSELGNAGGVLGPMHQAMVVLSNGAGGTDVGSGAPIASVLRKYMTDGRFPEDNKTLPKTPVPIISIWFPYTQVEEEYQNAHQFMMDLANPEIGGFYNIVRNGQAFKAPKIVDAVRARFDQMNIIKWRVPCVAPTINQTFKLVFKSTDPPIAGDNFIDVPVGIDPTAWPLDINYEETEKVAAKDQLYPGGRVRIIGNFCWGTEQQRAKLYLIPKDQDLPESLKGKSVEDAKKAQQELVATKLVGNAVDADNTYVVFELPDNEKFLQLIDKKKKLYHARLVVYDSKLSRTSAVTADKVLTLPAKQKPLNYLLIGAATFGGVVILLLIVNVFRGGGGARGRRAPAPRPAGPGPAAAMPPFGSPPP
jgi:hypothetical protein